MNAANWLGGLEPLAGNGNGAVVARPPPALLRPAPSPRLVRGLGAFREAHRITGSRTFWLCSRVHKVWRSEEWDGRLLKRAAKGRRGPPPRASLRFAYLLFPGRAPRRPPKPQRSRRGGAGGVGSAAPLARQLGAVARGGTGWGLAASWASEGTAGILTLWPRRPRPGIAKVRHGGALRWLYPARPAEVVSVM